MTTTRLRIFALLAIAAVAAVAWPFASADDQGKTTPVAAEQPPAKPQLPNRKQIMDDKLKYTQQVLSGLALNDRDKIKQASEKLIALSTVAEWLNADKTDEYTFQMTLFRRAAKTIGKRAEEKNIEGVLLAYNELTVTCLRCHQHERDFR